MPRHERMFPHAHSHKLDDPERAKWLPVDAVLARLSLRPGMEIADVGAGNGYFTNPLSRAVLPGGKVFAVDVQPQMLALLRGRLDPELPVVLVEAEATRTTLAAASVDLVFLANVWHEIDDRAAAVAEASRIVRPGGRIAILDWRPDAEPSPGPPLDHRVASSEVAASLGAGGWTVSDTEPLSLYHYLVVATRA